MRILHGVTGEGLGHAMRARAAARNVDVALPRVRAFDPEAAVTDFDSFSYYAARIFGLPIVSLDHQHVLDRFSHPPEIVETSAASPRSAPSCASSTTLVGPVVGRLVPALRAVTGTRFLVYGSGRGEGEDGNVSFRGFDEARFIADLATARAVIANGGFTTLAEALWLGKPVLSLPLVGQAEQELNAAWLDRLGLGVRAGAIEPAVVRAFLARARERAFARIEDPRFRTGEQDAVAAALETFGAPAAA